MRRTLALSALACLASSLTIPAGLPDGRWLFALDQADNTTPRQPRDAVQARQAGRRPGPLPSPLALCGGGGARLDSADEYGRARGHFSDVCDGGEMFGRNVAVVVAEGGAVAYMCNYDGQNRCWREEFDEANAIMDASCGAGAVAAVQVDYWKKRYGRANRGDQIC